MGIGGIGIWQLLIILVIVLLLFGTKKLRNLGADLGGAIKSFKKAVTPEEKAEDAGEDATNGAPEQVESSVETSAQKETEPQDPIQKDATPGDGKPT